MLKITIPAREMYDEEENLFFMTKEQTLCLEHSLVSISKWESRWCKPFISKELKTTNETIDYIKCMTLTQNVDPNVYNAVTDDIIDQVNNYIDAPMTATTFSNIGGNRPSREIVTSELIYYWMVAFNIPSKYEKWHLNRLLTLIRICNVKNQPSKKMSARDTARQYASLNEARRKRHNTKG